MYVSKLCDVTGMDLQSETVGADDPVFTLLEFWRTLFQTNSSSKDPMPTSSWGKLDVILKGILLFRFICKELSLWTVQLLTDANQSRVHEDSWEIPFKRALLIQPKLLMSMHPHKTTENTFWVLLSSILTTQLYLLLFSLSRNTSKNRHTYSV